MRPEKKYLVEDINRHLDKGDYVFLTNYSGINVPQTAELRDALFAQGAEFHVVKNTILNVAQKSVACLRSVISSKVKLRSSLVVTHLK